MHVCKKKEERELYVSSPVSWPLVPTEELRLMMRRRTSFLSKTREAGPSSDIALPPKCLYGNIQCSTLKNVISVKSMEAQTFKRG